MLSIHVHVVSGFSIVSFPDPTLHFRRVWERDYIVGSPQVDIKTEWVSVVFMSTSIDSFPTSKWN